MRVRYSLVAAAVAGIPSCRDDSDSDCKRGNRGGIPLYERAIEGWSRQQRTEGRRPTRKRAHNASRADGWSAASASASVRPFFRPLGVRLQQKSGFPSERAFYIGRPHNTKLHEGSNELCRKCSRRRSRFACLLDVAYGSPVSNCDSPPSSTSLNGCACARSALPEIAPPIHRGSEGANMQLCFPLRHFRCRRSLCTPLRRTGSRSFPD